MKSCARPGHSPGRAFATSYSSLGNIPKFILGAAIMADCVEERCATPSRPSRSKSARWRPTNIGRLVEAGAEGLVVYQETYHREVYT